MTSPELIELILSLGQIAGLLACTFIYAKYSKKIYKYAKSILYKIYIKIHNI